VGDPFLQGLETQDSGWGQVLGIRGDNRVIRMSGMTGDYPYVDTNGVHRIFRFSNGVLRSDT
jgi:hypothetical protein